MSQHTESARALQRKKRQAAALKANLKRRKAPADNDMSDNPAQDSHEESDS